MPYKNVLVPFDTSEPAQRALREAIDMCAGTVPVKITALRVARSLKSENSALKIAAEMAGAPLLDEGIKRDMRDNYVEVNEKQTREAIERFFDDLPDNVALGIKVTYGHPAEKILEFARDNKADCIVMGSRGLGAVKSAFGSVSTAVLRESKVPVLIVR